MNTSQYLAAQHDRLDRSLAELSAAIDQRMTERAMLLAMLKRTTFLLSSARLIVADDDARFTATEAVNEANALIRRCEGSQ
ncbi:MAG: hypothetical protein HS128_23435 [Ideonella sp.]|nr:hypothetical protein [Ideonella sp.]